MPNMVVGLQVAISRFIAEANDDPKPFAWLADSNKSIVAVRRGYSSVRFAPLDTQRPISLLSGGEVSVLN